MFVRWKKRTSGRPDGFGFADRDFITYTATLTEATRVNGKPRQRHVAVLTSMRTWEKPGHGRRPSEYEAMQLPDGRYCYTRGSVTGTRGAEWFWTAAREKLAALELADGQVQQIEAALAKVIPEPTEGDLQRELDHDEKRQAGLRQWYAEQGMQSPFEDDPQGQLA